MTYAPYAQPERTARELAMLKIADRIWCARAHLVLAREILDAAKELTAEERAALWHKIADGDRALEVAMWDTRKVPA